MKSNNKITHEVKPPKYGRLTEEWVVRWYVNGVYNEEATYYTNDRKDAQDTYELMCKQAEKMNNYPKVK